MQPNLNIREDSVASIDSQGLTGGAFVEISGGTANSPLLVAREGQRYPVIRTKQSTFAQLEQSAPEVVAKLNVAASRLNDLLNDNNRRAIAHVLANLDETTQADGAAQRRHRRHHRQCQQGDGQSQRCLQQPAARP